MCCGCTRRGDSFVNSMTILSQRVTGEAMDRYVDVTLVIDLGQGPLVFSSRIGGGF